MNCSAESVCSCDILSNAISVRVILSNTISVPMTLSNAILTALCRAVNKGASHYKGVSQQQLLTALQDLKGRHSQKSVERTMQRWGKQKQVCVRAAFDFPTTHCSLNWTLVPAAEGTGDCTAEVSRLQILAEASQGEF